MESFGEEIKISAERNKCLQDFENSTDTSKSNSSLGQDSKPEQDNLELSNSSLLTRVRKVQHQNLTSIKNSNSNSNNYLGGTANGLNLNKTPSSQQTKKGKIFGTPNVLKDHKFKTPNSDTATSSLSRIGGFRTRNTPNLGAATSSLSRTGGFRSRDHLGAKTKTNTGQRLVPSYQMDTASSRLKVSPTKVIVNKYLWLG